MLDIGWSEMLIVGLITIIVVGPKELPRVLRTVMGLVRKLRAMASEFQSGIDDLAREADLQDIKQSIENTASTDIAGEFEKVVDPTGEVGKSVKELEGELKDDPRAAKVTSAVDPGDDLDIARAEAAIAPPHSLGDSFQQAKPAKAPAKPRKTAKAPAKSPSKTPAKPKPKATKAKSKSGAGK